MDILEQVKNLPEEKQSKAGQIIQTREASITYLSGYGRLTRLINVEGTPGLTELALHTHTSDKVAVFALVNDRQTYGAVFFEDGSYVDGSFHLFSDETFSVS